MYVEVVFTDTRHRALRLSDALLEAGALSAAIEDADAGSADEHPLYGEPGADPSDRDWKSNRVVALFDAGADVDAALAAAFAGAGIDEVLQCERRTVADRDWVRATQAQFAPVRIGRRLWIVPSWHALPDAARAADAAVVRLDPGLAFGTGEHPTTRLCLAWLDEHVAGGERVIDYGCGSGILAIAALKLGAGAVTGTDIDEQALTASRENALDNDVRIDFLPSSRFHAEPADVVVANILANPLKLLAPALTALVAPGGRIVLSGILERQWRDVAHAYAPAIALSRWREEDGWICLAGARAGR